MRRTGARLRIAIAVPLLAAACQTPAPAKTMLKYPAVRKDATVDDYGGVKVADPYRWMEALDSKEVADWIAANATACCIIALGAIPFIIYFSGKSFVAEN